jgi:putative Ca2+/H+ antiporter (TMEM165/GDT1 family)
MNFTIVAITFGLIFVAELPDKTMIATIVMSSRSRPLPVFIGAAGAMVVNSAVAVLAGRLLELLPHRWVEAVVALLFAGGAFYQGEAEADKVRSGSRVALGAFTVIVVAELGDLTQILTANLVARYHAPLSVFVGAATALVTVMGVGVIGGRVLLRVLPLATIRRVAGIILAGFAIFTAVEAARG